MDVFVLEKTDFDGLENRKCNAITTTEKFFDSITTLERWFELQPKQELYLGWDRNFYPSYRVIKKDVTTGSYVKELEEQEKKKISSPKLEQMMKGYAD